MNNKELARNIMESIPVLHKQGYGLLKIGAYIKEGIGAWRHYIFAAETYPNSRRKVEYISGLASLPSCPIATGSTPREIAENIIKKHQNILCHCLGTDEIYQDWYQKILNDYPNKVITMEDRYKAYMDGSKISTPYSE